MAATVADGAAELKSVAHITTTAKGGSGAVRELIELIFKVSESLARAPANLLRYLRKTDPDRKDKCQDDMRLLLKKDF